MDAETALPRRVASRARRGGRHRSPDRLSVPRAAPALVLACQEYAGSAEIAAGITAVAGTLCPGAEMRAGYAGDGPAGLAAVLAEIADERGTGGSVLDDGEYCPYHSVVVPMALAPDPASEPALAAAAGQPGVTVTPPLGPHPVLAGALHDRLAEAGLVPPRRVSGLTLVSTQVGVLVCALSPATQPAAETVAVLLSARLGMPVAPVRLDSRDSLENGVTRLREAGASRLALAPYLIGPEIPAARLAEAATSIGAVCAAPLGAHAALGQLATMRYGAALLAPAPGARPGHQIA